MARARLRMHLNVSLIPNDRMYNLSRTSSPSILIKQHTEM